MMTAPLHDMLICRMFWGTIKVAKRQSRVIHPLLLTTVFFLVKVTRQHLSNQLSLNQCAVLLQASDSGN